MRLFIGLPLSQALTERLGSMQGQLQGPRLRVEPSGKWHLTLLYIGAVPSAVPYIEVLKSIQFPKFMMTIDRVGTFAHSQIVYYASISPNPEVFDFAQTILAAVRSVNPELKYRFLPHITMARGPTQVPFIFMGDPITEVVEKVILYESRQGRYFPQAVVALI